LLANTQRMSDLAHSAYQLGALHRSNALIETIEGAARVPVARGTMDD